MTTAPKSAKNLRSEEPPKWSHEDEERYEKICNLAVTDEIPSFEDAVFYASFRRKIMEWSLRDFADANVSLENTAKLTAGSYLIRGEAFYDAVIADLLESAKESALSFDLLIKIALEIARDSGSLPKPMQLFIAEVASESRLRPTVGKRAKHAGRDFIIARLHEELVDLGLSSTSNPETEDKKCASAVLAKVFGLGFTTTRNIINRDPKL